MGAPSRGGSVPSFAVGNALLTKLGPFRFFYWAGPSFLGRAVPRKSPGPLLGFNPNYLARFSGKTLQRRLNRFGPVHSRLAKSPIYLCSMLGKSIYLCSMLGKCIYLCSVLGRPTKATRVRCGGAQLLSPRERQPASKATGVCGGPGCSL